MISAPAVMAASATSAFQVSIEIATGICPASRSITGMTRCCSISADTAGAPGRVLSPPMSIMSAASSNHFQSMFKRSLRIKELCRVGKGVGCYIEDAHDQRACQRKFAPFCPPDTGSGEGVFQEGGQLRCQCRKPVGLRGELAAQVLDLLQGTDQYYVGGFDTAGYGTPSNGRVASRPKHLLLQYVRLAAREPGQVMHRVYILGPSCRCRRDRPRSFVVPARRQRERCAAFSR